MTRMLNALKQIEAKHPRQREAVQPVSAEELAAFGLNRPVTPWAIPSAVTVFVTKPSEESAVRVTVPEPKPIAVVEQSPKNQQPARVYPPELYDLADKILSRCHPERSQAFLFTRPMDDEGKASLLGSLAPALAERLGGEVLLVDAYLHRPDAVRSLGLSGKFGLADVLQDASLWRDAVRPTAVPHLSVLPGSHAPAGSFESLKFASLLNELRSRYRLIVLDSPSAIHPSTVQMAKYCEGVYMLVELGRTHRRAIRKAVHRLESGDAHLIGCIVADTARA
jgi:Mrp family chromosome partitioning ATPase